MCSISTGGVRLFFGTDFCTVVRRTASLLAWCSLKHKINRSWQCDYCSSPDPISVCRLDNGCFPHKVCGLCFLFTPHSCSLLQACYYPCHMWKGQFTAGAKSSFSKVNFTPAVLFLAMKESTVNVLPCCFCESFLGEEEWVVSFEAIELGLNKRDKALVSGCLSPQSA